MSDNWVKALWFRDSENAFIGIDLAGGPDATVEAEYKSTGEMIRYVQYSRQCGKQSRSAFVKAAVMKEIGE